ncbi:hypothetical protein [Varunaivibrio sulfuroxidans]|uniref:Uncharacterized protein n=1 Tax=Varunaivibrio sulfuroxidans TaxID=1773489 RepID=A0A4V2UN47_9PROT|nr:hypothetical protein [Varunaivibrio sulfuroxidans]TCS60651.1 hypothetical protein EDD55_110127 [Varunaivibrio sulfuroxidans]WES30140.1 hypothetical protein P3M64_10890 [Varunaivibrio sulfuroxidans]
MMKIPSSATFLASAAVVLLCAGAARAGGAAPGDASAAPDKISGRPMVDVNGRFRIIGQTDAQSESTCIGRVDTPLCVAETIVAVEARHDWKLQDIAYGKADPKTRKPFTASDTMMKIAYRIVSVRRFAPYDVPAERFNVFGIKAGDVAIYIETCNATYKRCTQPSLNSNISVLARKGKYGWYAVSGLGRPQDLTNPLYNSSQYWHK